MTKQEQGAKKGEIEFRKKLLAQQLGDEQYFDDEYSEEEIAAILKERMDKTEKQIAELIEEKIARAPYLEIGAERGQRSLTIENKLPLSGAACDISFEMLNACKHYQEKFKYQRMPLRICCDANNLPFKSKSLPFAFCYETLHHFPDPTPIIHEIHRVLAPGGYLLFDEEPYRKILHLPLVKGQRLYSMKRIKGSKLYKIIDYFFTERYCNETDYGVIENDKITVKTWKQALEIFKEKQGKLMPVRRNIYKLQTELYRPKSKLKYLSAYLLGGDITALARKSGEFKVQEKKIQELLICPSCKKEHDFEMNLEYQEQGYYCSKCNKKYPIIKDILMLLAYSDFKELYPELFATSIK